MEDAFFNTPLMREFAQIEEFARLPDKSTILRFRYRLDKHKLAEQILTTVSELLIQRGLLLKTGTVVDATLISVPMSTKNKDKARDPEMHLSKNGNQWYFGMKAHIGVDAESGLVHTVRGTSGHVSDIAQANELLHGQERGRHRKRTLKHRVLVMSDSSSAGVTAEGISYLTGYPLQESGLYALARTWPAPEMPRPGCVWTHTLFIEFADLAVLDSPSQLEQLFRAPSVETSRTYGVNLNLTAAASATCVLTPNEVTLFQRLATALYQHPRDQVWAKRASNRFVDDVVLRLWVSVYLKCVTFAP